MGAVGMSETRLRESVSNRLLLLYTIRKTNEMNRVDDERKLQKLLFLAQLNLVKSKLKALDYQFHRWSMGPYSAEISKDLDILKALDLVRPGWPIKLTPSGEKLLESCSDLLIQNKRFLGFIERVLGKYGHLDSKTIMNLVYGLTIVVPKLRERMTIEEVPMGTLILFKTSLRNAKASFDFEESWLDTLEIAFNEEFIELIAEAYDDAREGRSSDFKSVRSA